MTPDQTTKLNMALANSGSARPILDAVKSCAGSVLELDIHDWTNSDGERRMIVRVNLAVKG